MSRNDTIPPIVKEYILKMFNENSVHVKQNYRDNVDAIRVVCQEAVEKFDRDITRQQSRDKRQSRIRAAHA